MQGSSLTWLRRAVARRRCVDGPPDERINMYAALEWSFGGGDPTLGMRIVAALRDYWFGTYKLGAWRGGSFRPAITGSASPRPETPGVSNRLPSNISPTVRSCIRS